MTVTYAPALQRSWARVQRLLFSPFRLEVWLVLGFAAFLSEWLSGGAGSGFGGRSGHGPGVRWRGGAPDVAPALDHVRDFLHNPFWMGVLVWLLLAVVVVVLLYEWVHARGKFIFLDGVVRERAAIVEPWKRLARLGNSLFMFRILLLLFALVTIGGLGLITMGAGLRELFMERADFHLVLPALIGGMVLVGALFALVGLTFMLLDTFVVPIMYRHDIGVTVAWGRFLPLLGRQFLPFVLYVLLVWVLNVLAVVLILMLGFMTCCVGFLIASAPYVGQVVLLPIHVFFRGLGPEFLTQFGSDFDVFAMARPATAAPAAPAAPGPTA